MVKRFLWGYLFFVASCKDQTTDVESIASMGSVNLNDFIKSSGSEDLIDAFKYKQDTAFQYQEHYYPGKKKRKGYSFYYHDKKIGKWTMFQENGSLLREISFKNNKKMDLIRRT